MQFHKVKGFNALSPKDRREVLSVVSEALKMATGDSPPSPQELDQIFGSLSTKELSLIAMDYFGQFLLQSTGEAQPFSFSNTDYSVKE